jgi:alkaline phosphatase/alkaline phosphatase D
MTPGRAFLTFVCLPYLFGFGSAATSRAAPFQGQGDLAGEVTATHALLQTRLTALPGPDLDPDDDLPGALGFAAFEWSERPDFSDSRRTESLPALPENDFIVRVRIDGLRPGTLHHYRVLAGADPEHARPGPARRFRTLPGADAKVPVRFCMGSCMNYHAFLSGTANGGGPVTATPDDKRLGYPAFAAMSALAPDFFVGTGDIVYYDHPRETAARSLPELRRKWHEQFRFPRLIDFFAVTPAYWSKDDHDFRYNDADLLGENAPDAATGSGLFREQLPVHPAGDRDSPMYRTHRVNRHLQLWFTEGRDHRSPNRLPDGPEKSLWGPEQRDWLQRTLLESDATWKLIITPTPMVGPDDASKKDNHANLGGFRHEADLFFAWIKAQELRRVFTLCGDRHWQYHSIHPGGVEEFSCGALNDENSRRGVPPGSKKGTDPDALIRQPYASGAPTGGFLEVECTADASLVVRFRDDAGLLLHEVIHAPPSP